MGFPRESSKRRERSLGPRGTPPRIRSVNESEGVAELLAALAYGEELAAVRARSNIAFAPDDRARKEQESVAAREDRNCELIRARLAEVGSTDLITRFQPYFETFFERTEPADWVEAQAFHYVGDALVSDFADVLIPLLDPISAEIVRHTLGARQEQETFALDELSRAMQQHPQVGERIAAYARRIVGESITQTRRALVSSAVLGALLGGEQGQKRLVLDLLERHRARMDRLGIERVEADPVD